MRYRTDKADELYRASTRQPKEPGALGVCALVGGWLVAAYVLAWVLA